MAGSTARHADDTRPSLWANNHDLFHVSGIIPAIVSSFKAEVIELFSYDTNADGKVDDAEYYRFKVMNDGEAENDTDTLEAKEAREAAEAKVVATARSAKTEEAPPETSYFLLTITQLLLELSEHAGSAAVITRLGALPFCVRILGTVAAFRESVLVYSLELLWNCLEHSFAALGTSSL